MKLAYVAFDPKNIPFQKCFSNTFKIMSLKFIRVVLKAKVEKLTMKGKEIHRIQWTYTIFTL
jgi:hypothetical protein